MRSILLTIGSIFITFFASGQAQNDSAKIMTQIADLYNKGAYTELYQMHSATSKAQITEDQLTSFYKSKLRPPLGNIVSWKETDNKDRELKYAVQFDKGTLDLSIVLNDKEEINSILWVPQKNTNIKKRDVSAIKSNNPKQTRLQLLVDSLAVDHLQNAANCGLSIGIINGDKTEQFYYGTTNKKTGHLPDAETMYEIGSVTKTFTGILLAHAINEGKIKAKDDIRKYLPGTYPNLQFKGHPITIGDLSNHTSRLPRIPANLEQQPHYDDHDPYKNYSKEMMYSYLKTITIDTLPGTVNEYSNFGVALLGLILEDIYHQSLEDFVRLYVTGPAKMNNTKFTLPPAEQAKLATGYNEADGSEAPYWNLGAFNACGGLKSDLADMLSYLSANMAETNPDFKLAHKQTYQDATITVGLNWILTTTKDGNALVWHNGATAGFTSFCGYIKEKKAGVVILNNSGVRVDNIALTILKELQK